MNSKRLKNFIILLSFSLVTSSVGFPKEWVGISPTSCGGSLAGSSVLSRKLAFLSARESCHASFQLKSEAPNLQGICFSKTAWIEWLRENHSADACIQAEGSWKVDSPLLNLDPSDSHSSSVTEKKRSENFYITSIKKIPADNRRASQLNREIHSGIGTVLYAFERLREELAETLASADPLGIARSLLLGESVNSSSQLILRHLGWVHLYYASGIHLIALAWILSAFSGVLGEALGLSIQSERHLKGVITFLAWSFCWILMGARLGLLRPIFILFLKTLSDYLGLRWRKYSPLALAFLMEFILSHFHMNSQGILYALAVGGSLSVLPSSGEKIPKPFSLALRMSLGSVLFTMPLDWVRSHFISLSTPVLSLISVPLVSVVYYPCLVLGGVFRGVGLTAISKTILVQSSGLASEALGQALSFLLKLPVLWQVPRWSIMAAAVLALLTISFSLLFTAENPQRKMKVPILIFAILSFLGRGLSFASDSSTKPFLANHVEMIDVGQGDSFLVQDGRSAGLIDTGSSRSLKEGPWLEILGLNGVSHLDWIALSHLDEDHSGGVGALLKLVSIGCVSLPHPLRISERGLKFEKRLSEAGVRIFDFEAGQCIPYPHSSLSDERAHANSSMGAIFVPLEGGGFFFSAGDADKDLEKRFLPWIESFLSGNHSPRILKLSHHGSKTSTNPELLEALQPTEAWISCGTGNRYGHPNPETLEKLKSFREGLEILRTDQNGAVEWSARNETKGGVSRRLR
jgi:competence protein ComEC